MINTRDGYQITRHVCPRNCYDSCGMLAYVKKGRLVKITGDPEHGYTRGKLCSKGQNYIQRVYSQERIRYPMRQIGRGTGKWERLTWEQAMEMIATKIVDLKDRYGSTLPLCLNKYSGNFGILHNAVEGMFNSLGPTTQARGSPCWSAGLDAQLYDFGKNVNSDPSEIANAKLIILWGVNPAWTALHSLPWIYHAQAQGAKVVVIDPLYTETARKADSYIQIRPGEDGAFALALAKELRRRGQLDEDFIRQYTVGWEEFSQYLATVDGEYLLSQCGQTLETIQHLTALMAQYQPMYIWAGFGLQRHINGGKTLRAIDAVAAMTGNIGVVGSGVQYAQQMTWGFHYHFLKSPSGTRYLNINEFAGELERNQDPPVKLLWVSCRNLLTQDVSRNLLTQALEKLELIVTVEQFLTPTALHSDLVLPATTQFEEMDVVPSYWHHWIAFNEQAIAPCFDAKSDLEIAQLLAATLNQYCQGSSNFPVGKSSADFLDDEFNEAMYQLLGIRHWRELELAPRRANLPKTAWSDRRFTTASGKFEFFSAAAQAVDMTGLPEYKAGAAPNVAFPYWFITSHAQQGINSQFQNVNSGRAEIEQIVLIHAQTAAAKGVKPGSLVRVFNQQGAVVLKARISNDTSPDVLVCHQGWLPHAEVTLNALNAGLHSDMGDVSTGSKGMAFYDVFVDFTVV